MSERPLRIVFFMLHAGYIRYYRAVIETLAARGHDVELAFSRLEKDAGDARLADELAAANPNVSIGLAPQRRQSDGWRAFSGLVRALTDLSRYAHPRYAASPALRARVTRKIADHARSARGVDPLTAQVSLLLVRYVSTRSSEVTAGRLGRTFALIEEALPPSRRITRWLDARRPDVVLATPVIDFASSQVEYLKSARAAGIPTAVCVASWDNLTGKGLVRVVPDRMFVWNDIQRREAEELHGVPIERVVATGSPKFDEWFEREPRRSAAELAAASGLPAGPYVLYLCSSPFIAPDEVSFVRDWLRALRANALDQLGVLVRPHPQNADQWRDVDLDDERAVIWPRSGAQPDAGEARADFFDSIWHSAAVVGVNTSALIESAIVGKSVFTVLDARFAGTQEGTLHFHYLRHENGGFLHEARSLEEHALQLTAVMAEGAASEARTRRFVEAFVRPRGLDGSATPILVDEIERLAAVTPAPARVRPAALAVRALLVPVAIFGAVGGPTTRVARRLLRPQAASGFRKPPPELRYEEVEPSAAVRAVDDELRALGPRAIAGPWRGDRASELLVWLPFLRSAARRHELDLAVVPAGPAEWYAGFRIAEGEATLDPSLAERLVAGFLAGTEPIAPLLERLDFARLRDGAAGAVVVTGPGEALQLAVAAGRPTLALLTPDQAASAEMALTYRAARALQTPLTIIAPEQADLAAAIALSARRG